MRWVKLAIACLFASAAAATPMSRAEAGRNCPYTVWVYRAGHSAIATTCDPRDLVRWLRVSPDAAVSRHRPTGELWDQFQIKITSPRGIPPDGSLVLEEVYPFAEHGPVAYVSAPSIFKTDHPSRRWVVPAGWRTLDPDMQVPAVLREVGIPQPIAKVPPSVPSASGGPASQTEPAPDLVTLAFLITVLIAGIVFARRRVSARSDAH
jgi:hypothetical protein